MIITDFNRCKGCVHYTDTVKATSCCFYSCHRTEYEKSNLLRFTARGRFGSIDYKLDLRGITSMMNSSEQNRLLYEINQADRPANLMAQWLEYVEWLYEHEREDMPGPVLRRMTTLRNKLIYHLERIEHDAGREIE